MTNDNNCADPLFYRRFWGDFRADWGGCAQRIDIKEPFEVPDEPSEAQKKTAEPKKVGISPQKRLKISF